MMMTEAQVRAIELPKGCIETFSFKPMTHRRALELIDEGLDAAGLERDTELGGQFQMSGKGNARMHARVPLRNRINDDATTLLGIANSFDKSTALKIGFGSHVFVCSNGCFFAEKVVKAKHTPGMESVIGRHILEALGLTKQFAVEQAKFFTRLHDFDLGNQKVADIVVRSAMQHGVITDGEIVPVIREYHEPSFEAFEGERNAWGLHNAFTEVHKRIASKNTGLANERGVRLSSFFAEEFASDLDLSTMSVETVNNN